MNIHEKYHRARKVSQLAAHVPVGETRADIETIAAFFEELPHADRLRFAESAGVNAPSADTWRALIAALRARKTSAQIFDRANP